MPIAARSRPAGPVERCGSVAVDRRRDFGFIRSGAVGYFPLPPGPLRERDRYGLLNSVTDGRGLRSSNRFTWCPLHIFVTPRTLLRAAVSLVAASGPAQQSPRASGAPPPIPLSGEPFPGSSDFSQRGCHPPVTPRPIIAGSPKAVSASFGCHPDVVFDPCGPTNTP